MKNTLLSGDVALTRKKLLPLFLVYGTLIVLLVAAEILSPGFLAPQHMETIIRQVAFLGIVSCPFKTRWCSAMLSPHKLWPASRRMP